MAGLCSGSVVWARLGQSWWPGTVTTLDKCPTEYVQSVNEMKKMPIAIVKFFNENEFQDIHKEEHISVYNCDRKEEFIRKGQSANKNQTHNGDDLLKKFEADVVTAEKLTGGDMNIIENMRGGSGNKRRIDYSDLGFGDGNINKPKKRGKPDENGNSRKKASDIGEVICYKKDKKGTGRSKGNINGKRMVVQHTVKIMEQKRPDDITSDMRNCSNIFKCYTCGYSCSRLNVIIWHNKGHMNKVANYDSGIKIPGRRKRKPKTGPRKKKEIKGKENNNINSHAQTNGEVESPPKESRETQALLMDWEDEEDDDIQEVAQENGGSNADYSDEDEDDDDNGDYPPPQPRTERQPMPKAEDINSAFDALFAATPASTYSGTNSQNSSKYVNNDSDSECSDWDKWLAKDSASSDEEDEELESDIKSLCEDKDEPVDNGEMKEEKSKDTDDATHSTFLDMPSKTEINTSPTVDENISKQILDSIPSRAAPLRIPEYSSQTIILKEEDDITPHLSPRPVVTESALSILKKEEQPELQVQPLDLTQDSEEIETKENLLIHEDSRQDMIEDIYEISETTKSSTSQDSSTLSYNTYQNREGIDPMEEDYKYNMPEEPLQQIYKQSTSIHSSTTTETQILKTSASILKETDEYVSMLSHLEEEMHEEKVKPKEVTREDSESSSPQIIDDSPEESRDLQIMEEERESSEEKQMVYPIEEDSRDLQITEEVTQEPVQERTLPYSSVTYQVSSDDDDDVVQVQSSPEELIPVDEDGYRSRISENAGVGNLSEGTRPNLSSSSRFEGYDMPYRRNEYDYSSESETVKQDIHESVEDSSGDSQCAPSSGTTYMLVAVDAHGNTVPTPALSQGGNNLMAVEATMEGGTTRTLYIDPSQLGPNVDLNNMMLHIDTSGQEHVIIPSSSSSDSEPSYEAGQTAAYCSNTESTS